MVRMVFTRPVKRPLLWVGLGDLRNDEHEEVRLAPLDSLTRLDVKPPSLAVFVALVDVVLQVHECLQSELFAQTGFKVALVCCPRW